MYKTYSAINYKMSTCYESYRILRLKHCKQGVNSKTLYKKLSVNVIIALLEEVVKGWSVVIALEAKYRERVKKVWTNKKGKPKRTYFSPPSLTHIKLGLKISVIVIGQQHNIFKVESKHLLNIY